MTSVSFSFSPVVVPPVLALLRHGVPLTLLADLLDPAGPDSAEIARRERRPDWRAGASAARPIGLRDAEAGYDERG